jgi:hypothetical protein
MKFELLLYALILVLSLTNSYSQKPNFSFYANVEISEKVKEKFQDEGRFYLFLSKNSSAEPRTQTRPSPTNKNYVFAKNIVGLKSNEPITIRNDGDWISTTYWTLDEVPAGEYFVQILWDQDLKESRIDAPGNLYSETQK